MSSATNTHKILSFRRITGLTFVLLVLLFATNTNSFFAEASLHQVRLDDHVNAHRHGQLREAPDRAKRVSGHHHPERSAGDEASKQFSHSASINVEVEDDDDEETVKRKARERYMKAANAKKERLHRQAQQQQQQQEQSGNGNGPAAAVGVTVEEYDYHTEVHGEHDNDALVDAETGYGVHRRLIEHEGDTDDHRRHVAGLAAGIDKKLAREGDTSPHYHEAHLATDHYGHSQSDHVHNGPLGQRATRKIREHLIARGVIDGNDPNAKLHMPHDLLLTEEDYYHEEDLEFEEVEIEVGGESDGATVADTDTADASGSKSRSLSPSISARQRKLVRQVSSKSRSQSYSHRRPLAGARTRPVQVANPTRGLNTEKIKAKQRPTGSLDSVGAKKDSFYSDAHVDPANPNGVMDIAEASLEEIKASIVVADLNAHEKDKFENDDDENSDSYDNENDLVGGGINAIMNSRRQRAAAGRSSASIRYKAHDDFERARGVGSSSLLDPETELNAIYSTRRERMKALLREKQMFYAVQQPRSAVEHVEPVEWESFVCQVCGALAEEYSQGLHSGTSNINPIRLIENAEVNVTDFYTWNPNGRDLNLNDDRTVDANGRRIMRGTFTRTRSNDRWAHKAHTAEESAIRTLVNSIFHHFLVTLYEKEVFFAAMQNMATATRPISLPSVFVREELCAIHKQVCPVTAHLYEGGKFGHLRNAFHESMRHYERQHGETHEYVKQIVEERLLKHEVEMEDEEDRIAALEEEIALKHGGNVEGRRPYSHSLGTGDVDADGNRVIIEGRHTLGRQRQSEHLSLSGHGHHDPEARELQRRLVKEATQRRAEEDAEAERNERLKAAHYSASVQHEL